MLEGEDGGLGPVREPQLGQDARHVAFRRLLGDRQRPGDLPVRPPLGQGLEDVGFPAGKLPERVSAPSRSIPDSWDSGNRSPSLAILERS